MERLDEFSKLLAESVSRRESLRRIGAVLAGTVLSSLGVGTAWAARPDRCGAFCRWCSTKAQRNSMPGGLPRVQRQHQPPLWKLRSLRLLPLVGRPVATGHAPP